MLIGIKQNNLELLPVIRRYGCLFLCFANASPLIFSGQRGCEALNKIWKTAEKKGYISGDLNGDGDYDDDGEAVVLNHEALANDLFALDVKYDGVHHKANERIPSKVAVIFGRFVWRSGHFVQMNHSREVVFDPLGKSNAVTNGKLDTMRWYYAN